MTEYADFDASDKMATICVVDADGAIVKRDGAPSDPDALAKWPARHCPGLVRVVLETVPLSTFLYHGLAVQVAPAIERVDDFRVYLGEEFDEAFTYAALRKAESIGRPVGSPEWLAGMVAKVGRTLTPGKRGPKPRSVQEMARLEL